MSLVKIRYWFSPDDAAVFLSSELEAKVTVADIFQLVLDDRLAISVAIINPVPMRTGEVISSVGEGETASPHLHVVWKDEHVNSLRPMNVHQPRDSNLLFKFGTNISEQTGVFEVQMVGPARQLIEAQRQNVMKGVSVKVPMLPIILKSNDKSVYALTQLYSPSHCGADSRGFVLEQVKAQNNLQHIMDNSLSQDEINAALLHYFGSFEDAYTPSVHFPEDSSLVLRASDLANLIQNLDSLSEDDDEGDIKVQDLADKAARHYFQTNRRHPTKTQISKILYEGGLLSKKNGDALSLGAIERRFHTVWLK